MEKKEFVKEVKGLVVKFFNEDYNYQIEELTEDRLWIERGPMGYSLGFNIQDNLIGIFFEREIPEISGLLVSEIRREDTIDVLKANLTNLMREFDKIKKFYDESVMELLKIKKWFEPHNFKVFLNRGGILSCKVYDSSTCSSGIYQEIRVKYDPKSGNSEVSTMRSFKRLVEDFREGYNILYMARSKGLKATYRSDSEEFGKRHCLLIKESELETSSFPGWKTLLDVSEDLEFFKSI